MCKSLLLTRVFEREIDYLLKKKVLDQKLKDCIDRSTITEVMSSEQMSVLMPVFLR